MTIEIILTIYFSISAIFLFTNALVAMNGDLPNENRNRTIKMKDLYAEV